eukprot:1194114-Prorocentrum_minimum.AAC.4
MVPVLQSWCPKVDVSVSQLFIPMSYASILGGTCTLIGTSTNLVVEGQVKARYEDVTLTLFELGKVGVPVALAGLTYIMIFSRHLLPGTKTGTKTSGANPEDFMIGALVLSGEQHLVSIPPMLHDGTQFSTIIIHKWAR